jgi:hypothetical protein
VTDEDTETAIQGESQSVDVDLNELRPDLDKFVASLTDEQAIFLQSIVRRPKHQYHARLRYLCTQRALDLGRDKGTQATTRAIAQFCKPAKEKK